MTTVVIEYTFHRLPVLKNVDHIVPYTHDEGSNIDILEFPGRDEALWYVDEYYSDCEIADNGDEITVTY